MSDVLQDLSIFALAAAIEANLLEFFLQGRYWSQGETRDRFA